MLGESGPIRSGWPVVAKVWASRVLANDWRWPGCPDSIGIEILGTRDDRARTNQRKRADISARADPGKTKTTSRRIVDWRTQMRSAILVRAGLAARSMWRAPT